MDDYHLVLDDKTDVTRNLASHRLLQSEGCLKRAELRCSTEQNSSATNNKVFIRATKVRIRDLTTVFGGVRFTNYVIA